MKMRSLFSQDLRKVDIMSNHVICKQVERLTKIESNLDSIQKIQNMFLKIVITVASGMFIEFFSILIIYLINRKG